ncbi:hypothetical protein H4R24_002585 [Coemansia sp. RSA 988]|nr:hypothetical protein H4R24_002585 [Coemansia sp. RSA 988]
MAKQKRNLSWEISVVEAKLGKEKAMWKAKVIEAKRQRKGARQTKAMNATEEQDTYKNKELPGRGLSTEEISELETKLHRLRIEKAKGKLHSTMKHSRIALRGMVNLEKQSLARKVKRYETMLIDIKNTKDISANDAAEKHMQTESLILKCRENRKILDEINIEEILECFMFKLKSSNPTLRNELDITPLTPELEKLSKNEYIRQKIIGGQKAASIMRLHSNDITEIILGTTVRKTSKEVKKAKKSTGAQQGTVRDSRAEESDGNKLISDLDADSNVATGGAPASSTFVGSLGDYVDDESDSDTTKVKRKSTKRKQINIDTYDEETDQEFETIYNGKETHKNRPGQRARRKQYEDKYGEEANHIKQSKKEKKQHNSNKPRNSLAAEKDEKVHPSWQAKRREKELLDQAKNVKGKKIIFD